MTAHVFGIPAPHPPQFPLPFSRRAGKVRNAAGIAGAPFADDGPRVRDTSPARAADPPSVLTSRGKGSQRCRDRRRAFCRWRPTGSGYQPRSRGRSPFRSHVARERFATLPMGAPCRGPLFFICSSRFAAGAALPRGAPLRVDRQPPARPRSGRAGGCALPRRRARKAPTPGRPQPRIPGPAPPPGPFRQAGPSFAGFSPGRVDPFFRLISVDKPRAS